MKKTSILIAFISILPLGGLFAQEDTDLTRELEEKQKELDWLTEQVSSIDSRAKATSSVQRRVDDFRDAVTEAMLREAPEMKEAIERQGELVVELTAENDVRDREKKLNEYQELRKKLTPIEQRVQNEDTVKKARDAYQETLTEERNRIDRSADRLFERYRALRAEVKELKERLGGD